jgi:hypothetical protein
VRSPCARYRWDILHRWRDARQARSRDSRLRPLPEDPVNYTDPEGRFQSCSACGIFQDGGTTVIVTISTGIDIGSYWESIAAGWIAYWQNVYQQQQSALQAARDGLSKVKRALAEAASEQNVFSAEQPDCISGIETGRTWNPESVSKANGRVGLFQFDERNWYASGTTIPWDGGKSAKDPALAARVPWRFCSGNLDIAASITRRTRRLQKRSTTLGRGMGAMAKRLQIVRAS